MDSLTSACKSFVLALAVLHGRLDANAACKAARVAEQYQIDEWGEVQWQRHSCLEMAVLVVAILETVVAVVLRGPVCER